MGKLAFDRRKKFERGRVLTAIYQTEIQQYSRLFVVVAVAKELREEKLASSKHRMSLEEQDPPWHENALPARSRLLQKALPPEQVLHWHSASPSTLQGGNEVGEI